MAQGNAANAMPAESMKWRPYFDTDPVLSSVNESGCGLLISNIWNNKFSQALKFIKDNKVD